MWDEQAFRTKARAYFQRAEKSEPDDAAVLVWCLLGLEFMLRAPLAKVSPALLADPNGPSILHSLGYKPTSGGDAVSIQTKTVLLRLATVVEGFTGDIEKDTKFLVSIRNGEIHSSESPAENIERSVWMPKFLRVLTAMTEVFEETAADYLDPDFLAHAENLSDEEDKKLEHEVNTRIKQCRQIAEALSSEEKSARKAAFTPSFFSAWPTSVKCPSCDEAVTAFYETSRYGSQQLDSDSDEVVTPVFLVADTLDCPVCKLHLQGVREFKIAGIRQERRTETRESFTDIIASNFEPDYGND